ncbi:hypothetical protein EZV73_01170 [Acidaminobacter sp. JC074]|uniref:heme-binding protein n=1 Tax=Acidaminobacter sp. JC074 TaxID=2530199 RepID=UPI001F0DBC2A|nr:heme-binding protein [Acidaminobacter sp. JC074]MCH4886153.1 hypothetical protein [Acidaminobacter sp. JC074]
MQVNGEELISFKTFNMKKIYEIGNAIALKAIEENLKLCVDIYSCGKICYHFSSDKCSLDNINWLRRKRNSVLHFHNSTYFLDKKLNGDASLLPSKYGLSIKDYCIVAGAYPIFLDTHFLGAIAVSGMAPEDDHQIIQKVLLDAGGHYD